LDAVEQRTGRQMTQTIKRKKEKNFLAQRHRERREERLRKEKNFSHKERKGHKE